MKNGFWSEWRFSAFAVFAGIAGILSIIGAGICIAEGEEESRAINSPYRDEIDGLRTKAGTQAEEVNEAIRDAIKKAEAAKRYRYLEEELGYVPEGNLLSNEEIAEFEAQRTQKLEQIREKAGREIKCLQQQVAPTIEEQPAAPAPRVEGKPGSSAAPGTVTGIVFCDKKGAALVSGKVVRVNNIVRGIKVVRISPDYVEFEKQGRKWVQEVGQAPPAGVWEQNTIPNGQQSAPPNMPARR
jgi:hypothetical protein